MLVFTIGELDCIGALFFYFLSDKFRNLFGGSLLLKVKLKHARAHFKCPKSAVPEFPTWPEVDCCDFRTCAFRVLSMNTCRSHLLDKSRSFEWLQADSRNHS